MKILFKIVFFIALSVGTVSVSHGQPISYLVNSLVEKGDNEFQKFAYFKAANYYQEAFKKDSSNTVIAGKLADSYRLLNDQESAENWYAKFLGSSMTPQPIDYFYYARALESNKKYDDALEWYKKYQSVAPNDERAAKKIDGLGKIDSYLTDTKFYEVTPVKINSLAQDFSPTFYKEGIVFVSGRKSSIVVKKVFNWDNSSYLDLYYSKIDEDEHIQSPSRFNRRVNTKYHEGPLAFYDNESKVIFTRNNFFEGKEGRSTDDINKLKMYFADYEEGSWGNVKPFIYNDAEYSVGHPAVTPDGSRLIFVSDRPGSLGGTDLWYCYKTEKGWSEPINLGDKVNTEGNEMFPYLHNQTLYFSSDGYDGLGGLDVYSVFFGDYHDIGEIRNLGAPLNSSKDDFGYITSNGGESGYFSSNRGHELYDDIYHFNFTKPPTFKIRGLVEDEKDFSIISSASIILLDSASGDTLRSVINDRKGEFEFDVEWNRKYMLSAVKPSYQSLSTPVINTFNHYNEDVLILMRKKELIVRVIAVDEVTGEMIPKPHIIVLDPHTGHSLVPRDIEVDTSEFIIDPNLTYDVAGAKRQYFTKHVDRFSGTAPEGEVFWIVPLGEIELDKAIKLDNIYYNLDKSDIRVDAAKELDKLVVTLKSNPTVVIELSSHTDSRGDNGYNKSLSQKRAESATQYLISQGIASERIVAKGYGEEYLTNQCADGIICINEEHQKNRRTEFKVIAY